MNEAALHPAQTRIPDGLARYLVPYAIGFAPALLMVLSWSPESDLSPVARALRSNGATVMAAELLAIVVALREGMLRSLARWDWSRPVVAAIAVLVAVAITTALLASLQTIAIILTIYWFMHALFGLSIAFLCGRLFSAEDLVRAFLAGFAVVALLFVIFTTQIPDWASFDWRLDLPAFDHVRHAGLYFGPVAALAIGVLAVARRRSEWAWAFATAFVAIALSLWTGSRGAILAVAGALAVTLLLAPAMRAPKAWGAAVVGFVLATAVVSQVPAAPHRMMGITRTVEASVGGEMTTGRTDMWKGVVDAIQERPIFGYGEGQMREVAPFADLAQPHNSILQFTLAWGLVGLSCVLVLAFAFGRQAIATVREQQSYLVPAFIGLAAIAILSLVDNPILNAMPGSIFAACAGIIASRWTSESPRPQPAADRSG